MSNIQKITKEQFDDANNRHLPNGWIRFAYKYFSNETMEKDMSLSNNVTLILIISFFLGFFATILGLSRVYIAVGTIVYSILLTTLVFYLISAVTLNNQRLRKIMKILGVNKAEYNILVDKFSK